MGWNDHVSLVEMRCLDCGEIDMWEIWDEVAIARYSGELGRKLGHDVAASGKCPCCGSANGKSDFEDDDDDE